MSSQKNTYKSIISSANHYLSTHSHIIWVIVLLLIGYQVFLTTQTFHQLRVEEIAESIRNPYWFVAGSNYDTASIHVGWYQLVHWAQSLLGFDLYQGKIVKLILFSLSLISLTYLFKTHLKPIYALLLLLAFGLSPILNYFTSFQALFATDLLTIPIILFFLHQLSFHHPSPKNSLYHLAFWVIMGILPLIYITHIFYYPALLLLYFYKFSRQVKPQPRYLLYSSGILLPLFSLYFTHGSWDFIPTFIRPFIYDSAYTTTTNAHRLTNINRVSQDMFISGNSYHYELPLPDFSFFLPILAFLFGFYIIYRSSRSKTIKVILFSLIITALFNFTVVDLFQPITRSPGIRRNTPILLTAYASLALAAYLLPKNHQKYRSPFILGLTLLIFHHLLVIPTNLQHLRSRSVYSYFDAITGPDLSPKDYISQLTQQLTRQSVHISCQDMAAPRDFCRYQETFSAVASACHYQQLNCQPLYGFDEKTGQYLPITLDIYNSGYWDKHSYAQTGF